MPSSSGNSYTSYGIHTDHNLDTRSWIISRHGTLSIGTSQHELENIWSSKRVLDRENEEIVECIENRHEQVAGCQIHTPIKGWYLLITCPTSRAFKQAQNQSSFSRGKSYVNLVPSRTHPSIEFKFHLVHAASSSPASSSSANVRSNKRKSYTVIETDSDGATPSNTAGSKWTTFNDLKDGDASSSSLNNPFQTTGDATAPALISKQSTFILRPISHSIAKSQVQHMNDKHSGLEKIEAHHSNKKNNRMSLRGIASLFSGSDNSFELVWQDEGHNSQIPILIFEDHPSILHTETSGQLHLLSSLITHEFQMPPSLAADTQVGAEGGDAFDPVSFFVTVGIAYLDFLEDQEAYKAAAQG